MNKRAIRLALLVLLLPAAPVLAQSSSPAPTVSYPQSFAVSPPLSGIHQAPAATTLKVHARRPVPHGAAAGAQHASDRALQTAAGGHLAVRENPNFPGLGENGSIPGDPNIAVGPMHVVQVVNSEVAVFYKNGAIYPGYPKTLGSLWSALGGNCATQNAGDPIVQYDKLADRFIVTQLGSLSSPYSECVAVSTTNDPTGSYNLYSYSFGSNLNDYGKFGVWPTATNSAYLATYNLFGNGNSFVGADLCAYDRTAMLNGAANPAFVCFTISNDGSYLPSDLDGSTAPSDGSPGLFLNFETLSTLRMYQLSPNFANPGSSTLSAPSDISVAPFSEACGGGSCVPQPGTSRQLDSLGDRLMYRLAYRNFTGHEAMVVNHSVSAGSSVGVRWYELRRTGGGAFTLYQQGTFAPDSNYRWMGSAAMDQAGDIALGYSASSSSLFPSVNYTARTPADPLGTMEAEMTLQPGNGSQSGFTRWGDYSALRVDPSDDCTFWYTNEYYTATSSYIWSTAIGSFKLANCTGSSDFTISATASPLTLPFGKAGNSSGTVSLTSLNGFTSAGVSLTVACNGSAGITCSVNPTSVPLSSGGSGSSTLSIATSSTTPVATYPVTVTGTSGGLTHSTTLNLVVAPDFSITASPASKTAVRGSSVSFSVSLGAVGASSTVNLSVSGLPKNTSASFSPNPVTTTTGSSVQSTLKITVGRKAPSGTSNLNITGSNGNYSHMSTVSLTIN